MPTGTLRRVQTIVTGVAGSPYYLVGYFAAESGTVQAAIDAWHEFTATDSGASYPSGAVVTTEGEVVLVNPVTGDAIGLESGAPNTLVGTGTGALLPPSNQILVRWRTGNYVAGREVRGRTNLPCLFLNAADEDGGVLATTRTAVQGRAVGLIGDPDSVHVVWSKKNGVWWASSSASVWERFSVLRSRRD